MTSDQIKVLERLFAAEIEGRLPAQFKSKHLAKLEAEGYVEQLTRVLPGRFKVTVKGWQLTTKGHIAYCEWAAKVL